MAKLEQLPIYPNPNLNPSSCLAHTQVVCLCVTFREDDNAVDRTHVYAVLSDESRYW